MSEQENTINQNESNSTDGKASPTVNEKNDNAKLAIDGKASFDMILDIPVTISMEVGRSVLSIRKVLQLTQGSVIELERLAGEPLDVMVNGTLIAHGEVVVVNEKFGIRLTDIMSQSERIQKLQ